MEARREEIDTSHTRFIDAANPLFYSLSVVLIFFTLLSLSWPLVALWSCGFGVLGAYLLFRNRKLVPNLLLHLRPVVNVEEDGDSSVKDLMCPVCSNANCSRHKVLKPNDCDVSMPWKDLSVPETIDNSLSNFLNIIMARFITTWHK
ncbi:PREDICTED: sorting nexin-14-like [Amphimedon queenslandica]|uniref:Uncharacterized protein n=1 Tax=Amphimedon queenslandica TaxID=400682 RepID=A0A1X7VTZ8_AMPQE|nr:PREDICTED: sorting nexin-14-like [Amphimedon queenslandica]|eukprot:XP_019851954.1 PREDICTED: sorting nexin-14-like [Amphimedon queenslandica]